MTADLEFNKVTFGLPVEAFRFDAYITKDERLPVVTEYVLRLLRICETLTPSGLRDFFGFTDAEALTVVEALARQGLVNVEGEHVRLSSYANERFEASSSEDYPRFTKVQARRDSVTLDLLSFSPLSAPRFGFLTENSLRLAVPEESMGNSIERAKRTYTTRFHEIAHLNDGLRDSAMSVYSVEDVQSRKRGYIPVPVSFALSDSDQIERRAARNFEDGAAPELVKSFHESVSAVIPTALTTGNSYLTRFLEVFDLPWLDEFVLSKRFDTQRYANKVMNAELDTPKGVRPVFGNLYLEKNLEPLMERISSSRSAKRNHLFSSAAWMAPEHFLWGRGETFSQSVSKLRDSLRTVWDDDLHFFSAAEPGRERGVADHFRGVDHGPLHGFRSADGPEGTLGGRLELFLYPCGVAAALFHMSLPGNPGLWAPVGFVSSTEDHCATVHKLLTHLVGGQRYIGRLDKAAPGANENLGFSDHCSFLNFTDFKTKRKSQPPGENLG